ncbi:helix-turn-helix domain-containing protein [Streptococcus suis]|uniref:helix-turn-helix domain-containing protein n=2 Tax=Streptococcus suis TaxID=1307 RepID=UPI00032A44D9|nr:helix-turn-helix transcriptional regulator [Streptococcus suis]QBX11622.1 transcriptional repressor [Streptococcus satellite phage Javan595]AGL48251.1 Transcriptional regulator, XRE family [Streptococcus suis TL13]MBY4959088.1 helix-turn-helix domain-containing protein [Streptococcus suis]MBY5027226.1 helix-turn-helix domain-containing protein [Streptococcus suis]MBY6287526.1 helix-turn-helix domain-containing protein [Streptococcus suis]
MEIDNKLVGERIQNIRLRLGESMDKFGERFNTSKGTVNNWEKGRNLPNKENLLKISSIGKTSVEELLYGDYDNYLHLKIMELAPKNIEGYDEYNSLHDNITDKALEIARNTISKIDYQISDETIKKFIELATEQSKDLQGNLLNNDLSNFDYSLFGGIKNKEYFYFGFKLTNKEKSLYTALLAILNEPTKTIYIDDVNKERFFNLFGNDIPNSSSQSIDYITSTEIIPFSTYIRQRSKVMPKILVNMLKFGFLLENIDIHGYTVNILENQLTKQKTIKIDND